MIIKAPNFAFYNYYCVNAQGALEVSKPNYFIPAPIPTQEFLLCLTLKAIEEKLSMNTFVRTHRSFIINVARVDEVANGYVVIEGKPIPLSGSLRNQLLEKIQAL